MTRHVPGSSTVNTVLLVLVLLYTTAVRSAECIDGMIGGYFVLYVV